MDKYGNKIISVDFDKTLSMARYPEVGEPNGILIEYLIREQKKGSKIVLNTCRTDKALENAVDFCNKHGLFFDAINENAKTMIESYGDDPRKISADLYIDDKAVKPITKITHTLKIYKGFADAVCDGSKCFEIRKNDRGYQNGDTLRFNVIDENGYLVSHPLNSKIYEITYVLSDYELCAGYVVFGMKEIFK